MVRANYMGRVLCNARVENAVDTARVHMGEIPADQVRSVQVSDALVDTGASTLGLPTALLRQLGFEHPTSVRRGRNTTTVYDLKFYGPVRLWIGDRDITLDAMEVSDDCPVLIGQIPLEHLQYVVDVPNHKLVPSPANGGQWILDAF
jgi:predicted aspartyl protease